MHATFACATIFNRGLYLEIENEVTDMYWMFRGAKIFNSDMYVFQNCQYFYGTHLLSVLLTVVSSFLLFFSSFVCSSKWQVSKVWRMAAMFQSATAFNGDLSSWKTTSLTDIYNMFENTEVFNSGKLKILFLFN